MLIINKRLRFLFVSPKRHWRMHNTDSPTTKSTKSTSTFEHASDDFPAPRRTRTLKYILNATLEWPQQQCQQKRVNFPWATSSLLYEWRPCGTQGYPLSPGKSLRRGGEMNLQTLVTTPWHHRQPFYWCSNDCTTVFTVRPASSVLLASYNRLFSTFVKR